MHLRKVAVKIAFMRKHFKRQWFTHVIYLRMFKYFQTLSGGKWRSFANNLRSMLKLRSTLHAW